MSEELNPPQEPTPRRRFRWLQGFHSLQFKASVLVVLLVLVVTGFQTALGMRAMSSVLYENELVRTKEWARSLAGNSVDAVVTQDRTWLVQAANRLVAMAGVAYVVFGDDQGRVLAYSESVTGLTSATTDADRQTMRLESHETPMFLRFKKQDISCIDVLVPIFDRRFNRPSDPSLGKLVGYVRFAADISEAKKKLDQIGQHLSRIAISIVLLLVPCSLLVTRYVVAPLKELAWTAHAIANGSMDARARVASRDEIGDLAEMFNTMASRVAGSQMDLLKLNAELEERVAQRTQELEELAARDPLTGLYNRRYFGEVMAREFSAADRYDDDLTCLMLDLDHFKMINDRFGHRAGDGILTTLADAIQHELRGSDVAARFGGDEFIMLLPQSSAPAASALAERVVRTFKREVDKSYPTINPTLSIGVASLKNTRAPSAEALTHEADTALYAAKESGRNKTIQATASASA